MAKVSAEQNADNLRQIVAAIETGDIPSLRAVLVGLHPADVAGIMESVPPEQREAVWAEVDPEIMGEILLEVADGVRDDLLRKMDGQAVVRAVHNLDTDDIADILPDLPDELVAEILFAMDRQDRERLDRVLSYAEDTAGGLMDVDTVTVRSSITIEVVLRYLRRRGELPENTNHLFVVNRNDQLIGTLLLRNLVSAETNRRVFEIMNKDPVKFTALTPDTKVAEAFERYNLISAPVVDDDGRLLGRITIDDVVDVIREQADHSVMARAGLSEEQDIFAPVARTARNRAVWLGVNLLTAIMASLVIGQFENTIGQLVALAVLMPIVASMGGNAGTQTLTIVIRGVAMGTITSANARQVLKKELLVGGLNGVIWAIVLALVTLFWFGDYFLGLIIAVAMVINLVVSALAGVVLPLALRKLGFDPALASGVALTTVTDVIGFLSFLGLAAIFLV
jgi:magnesium transporter